MTLVAALRIEGIPVLIGDFLITNPGADGWFALDSLLEGDGFEPSVPRLR